MRAVAAAAGVDPALIHHYFTNKNTLLMHALQPDLDVASTFDGIADAQSVGTEFARRLFGYWEGNPAVRTRVIALLRVAMTRDDVAAMLREFQVRSLSTALGPLAAPDRRPLRLGLVATQVFGVGMSRYIVQIPGIRDVSVNELAGIVGPSLDRYLTGPLPAP